MGMKNEPVLWFGLHVMYISVCNKIAYILLLLVNGCFKKKYSLKPKDSAVGIVFALHEVLGLTLII